MMAFFFGGFMVVIYCKCLLYRFLSLFSVLIFSILV
jgi:hypothetical protein